MNMFIKRISLKSYRNYENSTFEFDNNHELQVSKTQKYFRKVQYVFIKAFRK